MSNTANTMPDHEPDDSGEWEGSMSSAPTHVSRDFQNNPQHHDLHLALKQLPTEPDVEHDEHVKIGQSNTGDEATKTSSGLHNTRAFLGLNPSAPIDEEHDLADYSDIVWAKVRVALREPLAEFFGCFIMVLFGDGSVAQVLLSGGEKSAPGGNGFGQYNAISWGWGIGVMLGQRQPPLSMVRNLH